MSYRWKPSKSAARELAAKMNEIEKFCEDNGIDSSLMQDSYYSNGEEDNTIYITASKTRLIEIYTALKAGKKLNRRGKVID